MPYVYVGVGSFLAGAIVSFIYYKRELAALQAAAAKENYIWKKVSGGWSLIKKTL